MNKLQKFGEIWELHKLTQRLADECVQTLQVAKEDLTYDNLVEAHRKMMEYQLCRAEYKERLDQWEMN